MARPLRIEAPGHFFHVLARGNAKQPIFLDDDDRERFLETVGEALERFRARCHAYCLMGNHYHLLLQPTEENLSRTLRHVNGVYSQRFNRRHGRVGHVFAGRFKSLLVDRETYLREIVRYVVLNPVRAGLVRVPEAWRWSSYRTTMGWTTTPAWLTVADLLEGFGGGPRAEAQGSFRRFVTEGLGAIPEPSSVPTAVAAAQGGILGSPSFVTSHAARVEPRAKSREHPRRERFAGRPALAELFRGVPDSGPEQAAAVETARVVHGYSVGEIAAWLAVDRRTVSAALRRSMGKLNPPHRGPRPSGG